MKKMYPRALEIATMAHYGQFRRGRKGQGGEPEPYIEHPKRVAAKFKDDHIKTVAILHDVFEDCPEFIALVKNETPFEIVNDIWILTRDKNENYFDFITRIVNSGSQTAMKVKLADLADNLATVEEGSTADKYRFAEAIILLNI